MNPIDNTTRFTSRAQDYAAHRPSYPLELLDWLKALAQRTLQEGLQPRAADLGCGTGIFTRLLQEAGWDVVGVEPNQAMKEKAQGLTVFTRKAEETGLETGKFQLVTAAQAFHWFEPQNARREMERILSPTGTIFLLWNTRNLHTPWGAAYETLVQKHRRQGEKVSTHKEWDEAKLKEWFHPRNMSCLNFANPRTMNWETLRGQLASTSYAPEPNSPEWSKLEGELKNLFAVHEKEGRIVQKMDTRCYWG